MRDVRALFHISCHPSNPLFFVPSSLRPARSRSLLLIAHPAMSKTCRDELYPLLGLWKVQRVSPSGKSYSRRALKNVGVIKRNEVLRLFETEHRNVLAGRYEDKEEGWFHVVFVETTKSVGLKARGEHMTSPSYILRSDAGLGALEWESQRIGDSKHSIRWTKFESTSHPLLSAEGPPEKLLWDLQRSGGRKTYQHAKKKCQCGISNCMDGIVGAKGDLSFLQSNGRRSKSCWQTSTAQSTGPQLGRSAC